MFPVNGLRGTTDEELGPLGVLVAFASIFFWLRVPGHRTAGWGSKYVFSLVGIPISVPKWMPLHAPQQCVRVLVALYSWNI